MKFVFVLVAAALTSGCSTLDEIMHEEYIKNTTPNPQTHTQIGIHGNISSGNWSVIF